MERVILVDNSDNTLGTEEKMKAHKLGLLHRAFSVFVFNQQGELMLQQRAFTKYHSPGLWTNTCCSHPREGETIQSAAHRRLKEEMGFDCDLAGIFDFIYKADVGQGLTENEFDHVLVGQTDEQPEINREEVNDWKFLPMEAIRKDMVKNPEAFTVWFRIAFDRVDEFLRKRNDRG